MKLTLVHLPVFVADWNRLRLDDADMQALEQVVMDGAQDAPVIAGTGGLRKLRFAPPSWHTGKRGAMRVVFGYFEAHGVAYLFLAYGKNEQANLTADEKRQCRRLVQEITAYLESQREF